MRARRAAARESPPSPVSSGNAVSWTSSSPHSSAAPAMPPPSKRPARPRPMPSLSPRRRRHHPYGSCRRRAEPGCALRDRPAVLGAPDRPARSRPRADSKAEAQRSTVGRGSEPAHQRSGDAGSGRKDRRADPPRGWDRSRGRTADAPARKPGTGRSCRGLRPPRAGTREGLATVGTHAGDESSCLWAGTQASPKRFIGVVPAAIARRRARLRVSGG